VIVTLNPSAFYCVGFVSTTVKVQKQLCENRSERESVFVCICSFSATNSMTGQAYRYFLQTSLSQTIHHFVVVVVVVVVVDDDVNIKRNHLLDKIFTADFECNGTYRKHISKVLTEKYI